MIGVCLVEDHPEADVDRANRAIERLLDRHELARVPIDTRLDVNSTGLRSKSEIEALIARMDVLVTTRLHGLVLALKNGVPAVAIDSVRGSGKIVRQCKRIGWPNVLTLEQLDERTLDAALRYALSPEARVQARACVDEAASGIAAVKARLFEGLAADATERSYAARQTPSSRDAHVNALADIAEGPNRTALGRARAIVRRLIA